MLIRASAAKFIGYRGKACDAGCIAHPPDAAHCAAPDCPPGDSDPMATDDIPTIPAALPARGGILRRRGYYGEA
jgi:hypothetical protein